jgi:hypothetical protein
MSSTYTVEYCYNCDGGNQEFSTAANAIKEVHPDAKVVGKGSDNYPIVVTILNENGKKLWTSDQRNLFKRLPTQRAKSIEEIKQAVAV